MPTQMVVMPSAPPPFLHDLEAAASQSPIVSAPHPGYSDEFVALCLERCQEWPPPAGTPEAKQFAVFQAQGGSIAAGLAAATPSGSVLPMLPAAEQERRRQIGAICDVYEARLQAKLEANDLDGTWRPVRDVAVALGWTAEETLQRVEALAAEELV